MKYIGFFVILSLIIFIILNAFKQKSNLIDNYSNPDYRNFYGISWRGNPHENLLYARQMGYSYVFYQQGMEKDSLSKGLYFYIESPEYLLYNRRISLNTKYSDNEVLFYTNYCVIKNDSFAFPRNLATGWFFNDTTFSAELDFQQYKVVNWAIANLLNKIQEIQSKNKDFHFGGFAWDVPQISGDFWSNIQKRGGKQVSSEYWSQSNSLKRRSSSQKMFKSYNEGRAEYYRLLFSKSRKLYRNAKFIMEPYRIYEDWILPISSEKKPNTIMPDVLCQESFGTEFMTDQRIFKNGLIRKDQVFSTTPNCFGERENRQLAGAATSEGYSFGWFGRFGGSGDMPNYTSIKEVPPRLKLIRVLSNWENLNQTPFENRHWDGENYESSNAIVNANIIAIRKPNTDFFFIVFLNEKGVFNIPIEKRVDKLFSTDSLFRERNQFENGLLYVNNNTITASKSSLNKGFIAHLK